MPTGTIHASDIGQVLRSCGESPTEARVAAAAKEAGERGGTVSFDEFLGLVGDVRAKEKTLRAEDVEAAFRVFDAGKTGVVHKDELKKILTSLGERLTEEEVEEMVAPDVGGDGMVRYAQVARRICP